MDLPEGTPPAPDASAERDPEAERRPEVVVYGSPGCQETRRAERRLEEAGVEYRRVEVAALENPIRTLRALVGDLIETPIVAVGTEARIGLDLQWLQERLGDGRARSAD